MSLSAIRFNRRASYAPSIQESLEAPAMFSVLAEQDASASAMFSVLAEQGKLRDHNFTVGATVYRMRWERVRSFDPFYWGWCLRRDPSRDEVAAGLVSPHPLAVAEERW